MFAQLFVIAAAVGAICGQAAPKQWAVLVAGSNGYWNYRHQADICHAYQILHRHGIPDEQIVVMMYDDIANNPQNPMPGKIINRPNGTDVYHGVPKDYNQADVTPDIFLSVLKGVKPGKGSNKVLGSGPDDDVFINLSDHGATNLFAFPIGILTTKQLIDALNEMHDQKRFGKLVIYVESCESGSLFKDQLRPNISIFATTASNYNEDSWACYCDQMSTCLGDCYSVNWMEDSDQQDIEKETLLTQFKTVVQKTTTSHAQEYGDSNMGQLPVGQFQGEKEAEPIRLSEVESVNVKINSYEVPIVMTRLKIEKEQDPVKRQQLSDELQQMLTRRTMYKRWITELAVKIAGIKSTELMEQGRQLTNLACHDRLAHFFHDNCFSFSQNPFALKSAHMLVNICELGYNEVDVMRVMKETCAQKPILEPVL